MIVYNLIIFLYCFVIERLVDLLVGSCFCGFYCVEMVFWVVVLYYGIFCIEFLVLCVLCVGNLIKSKRLKLLGLICVYFLIYNFGRFIEF